MNWKNEYQLLDLEEDKVIECTCKRCGAYKGYKVKELLETFDRQDYPSEVEAKLKCYQRGCDGSIRLTISNDELLEPFQGGLP